MKRLATIVACVAVLGFASSAMAAGYGHGGRGPQHGPPNPGHAVHAGHPGYGANFGPGHGVGRAGIHSGYYGYSPQRQIYSQSYRVNPYVPAASCGRPAPYRLPCGCVGPTCHCHDGGLRIGGPGWGVSIGW